MARAISDEELQLKKRARRRLIGAVILVTAVIVVLPMVLDSAPESESRNIDIRIPPRDAGPFVPAADPVPKASPERELAPSDAAKPAAAPEPVKSASAKSAKEPEADKTPAKQGDDGGYVLQVIALSDAQKAKRMQQRIAAAGIKSYTEIVKTEKGDVTRVRVGPFSSREAAEKARGKLKDMGYDGKAVPR